jgi:hypothetical protein
MGTGHIRIAAHFLKTADLSFPVDTYVLGENWQGCQILTLRSILHNIITGKVGIGMGYDIARSILEMASECEKEHSCLNGDDDSMCRVERLFAVEDNRYAIVQCFQGKTCPYKITYGTGFHHMCGCPVRIEIYKRYGK